MNLTSTRQHIDRLLYGFSDEIPSAIVHQEKYKVRGVWFSSLIGIAENLINNHPDLFTPDEIVWINHRMEIIIEMWNVKTSIDFENGEHALIPLTTKEDIEIGNELLRLLASKPEG